jgi:hypothetical protein
MKPGKNYHANHAANFQGIGLVIQQMQRLNIPDLFDSYLGKRPKQSTYKNSDIFLGWIYANLCGAQRLQDIETENIKTSFDKIPVAKLCSPDQISRVFRSFGTEVNRFKNPDSQIEHEFNRNPLLNDLLLSLCKRLGLLNTNSKYMIDYDGTTIPAEKFDCKHTYKGFLGYSPAVSMIGKIPVNIEARNGNTSASYKIKEVLEDMFTRLDNHQIKTWAIRMDAASYQKEIIYYLQKIGKKFFIRVHNTEEMKDDFKIASWQTVELHGRKEEISSVEFYPFNDNNKFRFVVSRYNKSIQPNEIEYQYRGIITNHFEKIPGSVDYEMSDLDVIAIYDQRGDSENNFRDLLNDFNWSRVPFSDMNANLVFMYVSAMAKCIYEYILVQLSAYTPFIRDNYRLKIFVARFIKPVILHWEKRPNGWKVDLMNLQDTFAGLRRWITRE